MKRFGLFLSFLIATLSFFAHEALADNFSFYANNTKDELLTDLYPGIPGINRYKICKDPHNTTCSIREAVRVAEETLHGNNGPLAVANSWVKIMLVGSRTHPPYRVSVNDINVSEDIDFYGSQDTTDQTVIDSSGLTDYDTAFNVNDGGKGDQNVKFFNIVFMNGNRVHGKGGAVAISSKSGFVGFYFCNFWKNHASAGGAVALVGENTTLEIWGTHFTDNSSDLGGAIFANHGYVKITDSSFKNNDSQNDELANDVYLDGDAKITRKNSGIMSIATDGNSGEVISFN